MNKIFANAIVVLCAISLFGCGGAENSDGSSKSTYSSCKIISSNALFNRDRQHDLQQCWDGVDFESRGDAMAWCEGKVSDYIVSAEFLIRQTAPWSDTGVKIYAL